MENNNQEPIVLGTVKKGKTGKPIVAIIIILLVLSLVWFLPLIDNKFGEESIIDLIKNGQLIDYLKNGKSSNNDNKPVMKIDSSRPQLIQDTLILENDNLIVSDIKVASNVLSFSIRSKNATYDASESNLYLNLYEGKTKLIYTYSLDSVYSINGIQIKENIVSSDVNNDFYISLNTLDSKNIPDVVLSSDESGLASLDCVNGNDTFEYIFSNKKLIEIKRTFKYKFDETKEQEYTNTYKKYSDLKNEREKFGITTDIIEDYYGFTYTEDILLESVDVTNLDGNYYKKDTEAKIINYKQEAKGFECE